MKCIVCDKCGKIIKNSRQSKVITCARPLRASMDGYVPGKSCYRGNDRQQNDILWEKELCDNCLDDLETFLTTMPDFVPQEPTDPDIPESNSENDSGSSGVPDDSDNEDTTGIEQYGYC